MGNTNSEKRLGNERMLPLVLRMALPCVAAQLINLLYNIVDRIFIGHIPNVGTNALAGVGVTSSVIVLIMAFSNMIGMGGAPLTAIALGKGNHEQASKILGNGAFLLVFFAVLCSIATYVFMEPILFATGASTNTLDYAKEYLSIYLMGTIFVLISLGLNTFITLQGKPAIAMLAVAVGAITNIILDYVFIFLFNMGVSGAAYATIISQAMAAACTLGFLTSKHASLPIKLQYLRPNRKIILLTLSLGISPFIMSSTEALIGFVLNGSLKEYGDIHISAMAILQAALLFAGAPISGFTQGMTPIISYNYGCGNKQRIKDCIKISLIIAGLFNFILISSMIIFAETTASLFTNDPELIAKVGEVMPVFYLGMTLFGMQRVYQNSFIALKQVKISIFIAMLRKIILLIPLALLLPIKMGVMGLYWAEAIADFTAATCCSVIFYFVFRKIMKTEISNKSFC